MLKYTHVILIVHLQMLAQINIFEDNGKSKYEHCSTRCLMWKWRKPLVLKLLIDSGADALCLQEVDHQLFLEDILPYLQSMVLCPLLYDVTSRKNTVAYSISARTQEAYA